MVLEHCGGGDLCAEVQRGPLAEARARDVMVGILEGLAHLHALGVIHRDVKAGNILIGSEGRAKLADFGLACLLSDTAERKRRVGSPGYAAPEVYQDGSLYGTKVDVFGAGVVLFYSLCGRLPFWGSSVESTARRTLRCEPQFEKHRELRRVGSECLVLLAQLLRKRSDLRVDARDALRSAWLTGQAGGNALAAPAATPPAPAPATVAAATLSAQRRGGETRHAPTAPSRVAVARKLGVRPSDAKMSTAAYLPRHFESEDWDCAEEQGGDLLQAGPWGGPAAAASPRSGCCCSTSESDLRAVAHTRADPSSSIGADRQVDCELDLLSEWRSTETGAT